MNEDDGKPVDGLMEWGFPGIPKSFPKISDQAFLLIHMSTSLEKQSLTIYWG